MKQQKPEGCSGGGGRHIEYRTGGVTCDTPPMVLRFNHQATTMVGLKHVSRSEVVSVGKSGPRSTRTVWSLGSEPNTQIKPQKSPV